MDLNLKNILKGFTFAQLLKFGMLNEELKELSKTRVEECNKCEYLKNKRCSICSCFIPEKTFVKSEHCPINKW